MFQIRLKKNENSLVSDHLETSPLPISVFATWVPLDIAFIFTLGLCVCVCVCALYTICLFMPLPQDETGHCWCCPKLGGKLQFEPAPFLCSNIISVHPKQCVWMYWLSVAVQLPIKPRALRSFKKIAAKINIVVILSTAGWSRGGAPLVDKALLRHTLYICGTSSLISALARSPLSPCLWHYGWFSLFHFFFHSKCMLRPIAVLLRTRSDPCKAASDGWLNHDESLGSLIYMPLNSTFGSIRTKSNIYVVYWNC